MAASSSGTLASTGSLEPGLKEGLISVAIIGDAAVGKTSCLLRYTEDTFRPNEMMTVGLDFKEIHFSCPASGDGRVAQQADGEGRDDYTIRIYDTAGQERYRSITGSFLKRVEGIVVVFDVTKPDSVAGVLSWLRFVEQTKTAVPFFLKGDAKKETLGPLALVGNKTDLLAEGRERDEAIRRIRDELDHLSLPLHFVSALQGDAIRQSFDSFMTACVRRRQNQLRRVSMHRPPITDPNAIQQLSIDQAGQAAEQPEPSTEPSVCCR